VADLLTAAKAKPLLFATSGTGSIVHYASELFVRKTGVPMTHVPYKRTAPAMPA
jgi:tripartite-type tricarboxylate transporter receptor subunit TctC